jgi:hypothetical protein
VGATGFVEPLPLIFTVNPCRVGRISAARLKTDDSRHW